MTDRTEEFNDAEMELIVLGLQELRKTIAGFSDIESVSVLSTIDNMLKNKLPSFDRDLKERFVKEFDKEVAKSLEGILIKTDDHLSDFSGFSKSKSPKPIKRVKR